MYPELFRIGPIAVHSYGVLLALSFILGIILAAKKADKRGINGEDVVNIGFVILISSVVGARFFYVIFHLSEFRGRWIYTFWPIQEDGTIGLGGLILLGGFVFAFVASMVYIMIKKLDFWKLADSVAPSIALGIFLTRIGCFLNGCCFGKACDLPWGVRFPHNSPAGAVMGDAYLHPTQLYSSLYGLIIFTILMLLDRRKVFHGFLFGIFLVLYGISRFTVDFFRYYESQMFIIDGIEFNQLISILMLISGLGIIIYHWRKENK